MNFAQSLLELIRWGSRDRPQIKTENVLIVQQRRESLITTSLTVSA
ncbi:hypothetical protein [Laspinema olomoucense]|nr:hypothetical protein [Laspinema sp. D3d]MCT7971717.1 hypothetical protein [Laspinema sp. D3d]